MIRAIRSFARLFHAARVLARHDALFPRELVRAAPGIAALRRLLRIGLPFRQAPKVLEDQAPGRRLAAALEALGPSFIKLGQSLATRPDLLGEAFARDLMALQDRLPPFPGTEARAQIAAELDQPVEALFAAFDDAPVAAASIAQVHFAETPDGRPVAVKILRPGIEGLLAADLDSFRWGADWAERMVPALRRLRPRAAIEMLADTVRFEMDLRLEAAAASELAETMAGIPGYRVPEIDWQRTAARVLTLERIDGVPIGDRPALAAAGFDLGALAATVLTTFLTQALEHGFFHGDMHQGNLFVEPDGAIAAVDFGIMGRLDRAGRYYLAAILAGFVSQDYDQVARAHFEAGYIAGSQSVGRFAQALRAIGEPIFGRPAREISLGRLLAQLFEVTETFDMPTQPQLLLLQKTMLMVEGLARHLDPDINVWETSRPVIERWMQAHFGLEGRLREAAGEAVTLGGRLSGFLGNASDALARTGETGIRIHPESLDAFARQTGEGVRGWRFAALLLGAGFLALILWSAF